MYKLLLTSFYAQAICLSVSLTGNRDCLTIESYVCLFISTVLRLYWTCSSISIGNIFSTISVYTELGISLGCILYALVWRAHKLRHSTTADAATLASLLALAAALAWTSPNSRLFTLCAAVDCLACVPEISGDKTIAGLMVFSRACRVALWLDLFLEGQRFPLLLAIDAVAGLIVLEHSFMWWTSIKEQINYHLNVV